MEKRYTLDIPTNYYKDFFKDIKDKYNPKLVILPEKVVSELHTNYNFDEAKNILGCSINEYYGKYCVVICEE